MNVPEPSARANSATSARSDGEAARRQQRLPLFFLGVAAVSYTVDVLLLCGFVVLGTVPGVLPVAGAVAAVGVCTVMYWLIRYRSEGRAHDPAFQVVQVSFATMIQLASRLTDANHLAPFGIAPVARHRQIGGPNTG